jgi:hypothetical protein
MKKKKKKKLIQAPSSRVNKLSKEKEKEDMIRLSCSEILVTEYLWVVQGHGRIQ